MTSPTIEVFFYGLFMDENILLKNGLKPTNPRKASLPNYGLRIGERATLLASEGETSYGVLMQVDEHDLSKLYSEKSVSDYVPEMVKVITDEKETIDASCYNLPANLVTGSNASYAKSLLQLATSLDFPAHYLKHIEKIAASG